jgi:hypothetical protein
MGKLKPCPFCPKSELSYEFPVQKIGDVICDYCGASAHHKQLGDQLEQCEECLEVAGARADHAESKIAQLEKVVELACHRTITPCPALETFGKCPDCPGFYPEGLEGENEACTRGKMAHYMQKAKEATNGEA